MAVESFALAIMGVCVPDRRRSSVEEGADEESDKCRDADCFEQDGFECVHLVNPFSLVWLIL